MNQERETISCVCYMTISRLCEVIPFLRSLTTEFRVRKLQLSAEMQIHDVPRHVSTEYDQEHYLEIPNEADDARVTKPNTIQNPFREYKATKLQC